MTRLRSPGPQARRPPVPAPTAHPDLGDAYGAQPRADRQFAAARVKVLALQLAALRRQTLVGEISREALAVTSVPDAARAHGICPITLEPYAALEAGGTAVLLGRGDQMRVNALPSLVRAWLQDGREPATCEAMHSWHLQRAERAVVAGDALTKRLPEARRSCPEATAGV